jgi:uncharacterized protein YjiK
MEPDHEIGKEAHEILLRKQKQRKMKLIIRGSILLVAITMVVLFWSNIKDVIAADEPKGKKEKTRSKDKDKTSLVQEPVSPGVTISKRWDMPQVLTEISGLSYIDADRFACVQDEMGTIFIYNTKTSAIEKEIVFSGAGDYEGLAMVNETVWVVRSDGHLYEVNNINTEKPVVKQYDTPLTVQHNIEGLCYDKKNNRLLLASKDGEPGATDYKGIYAFDLTTKTMQAQPAFKIDLTNEVFANGGAGKKKSGGIMPSSIAINPVTNDLYITDGRKAKLLVLTADGGIKKLYSLNSSEFPQPEGITFKPSGELFIANEGPKQAGSILSVEVGE